MSDALSVRRLDLSDDADVAAAYAVECDATSAARPGWVPLGEVAGIAAWRAEDVWDRKLVAASDVAQMVGFAIASTARATPETVVELGLVPSPLRAGVGLLKGLVDAQAPSGELG